MERNMAEEEPRRSRRRAYVSLQALEERARASATPDEHDALWGGDAQLNDDDDESFDEQALSDSGEVSTPQAPQKKEEKFPFSIPTPHFIIMFCLFL